jgi:acylphosphatase
MFRRRKEGSGTGQKDIDGPWKKRCGAYKKLDARVNPGGDKSHRERDSEAAKKEGLRTLQSISSTHGPDITRDLLTELEGRGLALDTQVFILRLCQTENLSRVINALKTLPKTPKENLERPLGLQWDRYQNVLESVLSQKEGQETFDQFLERINEAKPPSERKAGWASQWINILRLSLKHGLPLMSEALDYIPLSQISPLNFEERLMIEREIAETGEGLTEREYACSPGPSKSIQGVGFRGHCQGIAIIWGLTGYARNNPNETVAVLVQGDSRRIDGFRETLSQQEEERYNNIGFAMELEEETSLGKTEIIYEKFDRK